LGAGASADFGLFHPGTPALAGFTGAGACPACLCGQAFPVASVEHIWNKPAP